MLDGAAGVTVSPDGTSVYVTSAGADAIVHFSRAANGDLTFAGCISSASTSAANGCTSVGSEVLDTRPPGWRSARTARASTSRLAADAISHFSRAANGDLTFCRLHFEREQERRQRLHERRLGGARGPAVGVAVSPDGASVYVTSVGT